MGCMWCYLCLCVQVSMSDQLPWVPPWQPILEEKPDWALQAVRLLAALWSVLGFVLWCCLRPKPLALSDKKEQ